MIGFLLAATMTMAAPEPQDFYVEIAIRHGDPLAAPGDKSVEMLSKPSLMLQANQTGSVSIGLPKETAPIVLKATITPRDKDSVNFKANLKVQINDKVLEKDVDMQVMHSKPLNIRIGSLSAEEQVWATVVLWPCVPNPKNDSAPIKEVVIPLVGPQPMPSPATHP